jgi:Family of unknown function (DUF5522)
MNKLVENIDFYYDEQDNMVLTAKYHLDKGYCCGHGCRHCPYKYENVPEPRRTLLLKERKHAEKENRTSHQNR